MGESLATSRMDIKERHRNKLGSDFLCDDGFRSKSERAGSMLTTWNLVLLLGVVGTNILALYSLSVSRELDRNFHAGSLKGADLVPTVFLEEFVNMKEKLKLTQRRLMDTSTALESAMKDLKQSQRQSESLREQAREVVSKNGLGSSTIEVGANGTALAYFPATDGHRVSSELLEYTAVRKLPLGMNPALGLDTIVSSIGHMCARHRDLLDEYMTYAIGELCPDDWELAQRLMVRGCEPLPRRRCFSRGPPNYSKPLPFPESLWTGPPDDTIRWTFYSCKSIGCLNRRNKESKVFVDCADCFDLDGPERHRWVIPRDRHDFMRLDEILALKEGTIRIGLDIGGGSASFAARMREHNVTILTSTLNLNGPFNEFIALRGLPPLFLSIAQRLPFFDNTLDLVHSMHVLSNWIPLETLDFLLYDIDRVLRPGGILWLDHFFCTEAQLADIFIPMIEKLGFKKLRWVTGLKSDKSGVNHREVYLSALLEKPIREIRSDS